MADAITIKALQDASLDAKSLEEVVNGNESKQVTTRKGETYPSVKKAIKTLFQNGGLPATPFATKALMTASPLVDGKYAMVTDDTVNNGLYVKTAGAWVKSAYDPLAQAKAYADANPLFKPVFLQSGANLDTIGTGNFTIPSGTVGVTITGVPWEFSPQGYISSIREYKTNHQIAYPADTLINKVRERFGNGKALGDPLFAWLPWQDVVSTSGVDASIAAIKTEVDTKPTLNLFPNPALTSESATLYQGASTVIDGFNTLKMDGGSLSVAYYDVAINDTTVRVGDTITLIVDAYTNEFPNGAELAIAYLNSAGALIGTLKRTFNTKASTWETLTSTTVVPVGAVKLQIRLLNRGTGIDTQFRKPVMTSNAYAAKFITLGGSTSSSATTVYVAKTGSDANEGTKDKPFLTISKAVMQLPNGGDIIVLDSGDYRETVAITSFGHVKISATAGNRVNIFGSDKLVVTKTAGMTKVYQAPLAAKPTGVGGLRGKPLIAEWGTKSKPITESERHPLQRGLTHRLPYTEMFEAASKAELDTVNGKWFWEAGIIYFTATDGSDASLKRYEARARPTLTHNNGIIELNRVSTWFSSTAGMRLNGLKTTRQGCTAYGSMRNGFDDNANLTLSHKDISGGNGNDGFNPTLDTPLLANSEFNSRLEQIYFDPYAHDNGDDGLSCHFRGDATIYGGLFEYNTKADVVHVTGANCICYNTVSRSTRHGFYSATPTTGDNERVKSVFRCVNTVAINNEYSYTAWDDSVMQCVDTKAINPLTWGYYQAGAGALYATDCKYDGDALKMKSGNVVVSSSNDLTP